MPAGYGLLRSLTKSASPVETVVSGKIPSWVAGTLYRNGPGRFEFDQKEYKHLFDGHSCIHKFKIEDGKCWYSNKLLETKAYTKTVAENRIYSGFGTQDICSTLFGRIKAFFSYPDTMDNTNVNVMPYANQQLYALTETNYINRLDPSNLSIKDTYNVTKYMDTVAATFAHPHILPDGSWITMGRNTRAKIPTYQFLRYKSGPNVNENTVMVEQAELINKIQSTTPGGFSYFHSFGLSENYIIYLETALKIKVSLVLENILKNRPLIDAFVMDRTTPTRIHLINRHTGEISKQKLVTDPLFTFHHINAFEQGKELVVDLCAYDAKRFNITDLNVDKLFSDELEKSGNIRSIARRISIPLDNKETDKDVHCEIKDLNSELAFELPIINYGVNNCKPYRYVYGTNIFEKPFSVVKIDVAEKNKSKQMTFVEQGRQFLPTEAIFVPNPEAKSEDDGVLLVMCLSDKNDFLSVLDAKDLTEIARADVPAEVKGAFTFHGFFADKQTYPKLNV